MLSGSLLLVGRCFAGGWATACAATAAATTTIGNVSLGAISALFSLESLLLSSTASEWSPAAEASTASVVVSPASSRACATLLIDGSLLDLLAAVALLLSAGLILLANLHCAQVLELEQH